ncbi:CoA-acylating methylmalonate-semialdehyde dehydrogenase [Legionella sp. CNM-4043-24]|uniref:CoA-acylating methylmalonate-semialdehyde dehydrogenase n=1 Tax=Legionella sp. CNM-4043-24 TaxID=3421646 RepID=UPI00403B0EE4
MVYSVRHYIGGQLVTDNSNRKHDIYNPAHGEIIGSVCLADHALCDLAVKTAREAWESWSQTPPVKRARILFNFRDLLEKNHLDLARLVTREHGKTIDDAKGSVARAIEVVELHCGLLTQMQGRYTADVSTGIDCHTIRQPLGVCAGVAPFNFPVMVPVWMMAPAIACGNTFILKPSEQDPSAALRLVELLSDAGLPDGVVNCVQGDKNAVDYLLHHPDIAAFTAVASTPVAESIYTTATANGKRAHTFGGAKNHCLVMPDADLAQAAQAIVGAAYGSAGERCMAISVVVAVGDDTADQLLAHLLPLVRAIRIDAGDVEGCDMGPLISQAHRQRVLTAIDQGVAEGARLLIDGRAYRHPQHPQGYFVGPCLFDRVDESMSVYQNEIFGPVLVMVRVKDFNEGLALVNRHQYGNGTAIFTRSGYYAREFSHRVQAGMVGVNIPIPVPVASHPFGGWKRSCFGDTNMHGEESVHFYTRLKTTTSRWPVSTLSESAFIMPTNQ